MMILRKFRRVVLDVKGFTIAEMMAAVGVIAVIMAVAVPNYQAIQPGMRLNGAAREVLGKLMWARAKAVEQNSTYAVNFPTNHTVQIFSDANGNNAVDAGEWSQTIDIQTDYTGVTLSSNISTVSFSSRGTGVAATITITNTTGSKTVTVVATGNVKIS